MAGVVHQMISKIIATRSAGNAGIAQATSTKLLMMGIDPSKWSATSPDDAAMVAKVKQAGASMGVTL